MLLQNVYNCTVSLVFGQKQNFHKCMAAMFFGVTPTYSTTVLHNKPIVPQ